jgi:Caspase domain
MIILTDDSPDQYYQPTGQNMLAAFHWLVTNNYPGDSLFLHYSGHGGLVIPLKPHPPCADCFTRVQQVGK